MANNNVVYSRPFFARTEMISSQQTIKVIDSAFYRIVSALYWLEVIYHTINTEAASQVHDSLCTIFSDVKTEMDTEMEQLAKTAEDNGVDSFVEYSDPKEKVFKISSPLINTYASLILQYDQMNKVIDSLWLSTTIDNGQMHKGRMAWRNKLVKVANKVIDIQKRARKSEEKKQKGKLELIESEAKEGSSGEFTGDVEEIKVVEA